MRSFSNRKTAESVEKWQTFIGAVILATLTCFFVFGQAEISRAGLACLSNPCVYGICIDEVNSTFLCYCIDGYTGLFCQTNWDECWSNPCKNGGVCIDGIAHYNCTCPQGYQGQHCEQNINECDSNPCHNNGTCQDGSNGYTCICPSGYLGELCETDISVCNDTNEIRCLNGGLCIEGPGFTFNCACPLGWTGLFCEEAIDECSSSPCYNGAVCLDLQANYTCACPFGYTGRNCEMELEMCGDTSPCQNGAVCLVEDWLRVCYCVPDFHGDRCQFRYNECLLGPGCQNGGTCIDGVDGYTCSCPPKWSGMFCECRVVNEEELDCDHLFFGPTIETTAHKEIQNVPTWVTSKVPKIMPTIPFPTVKTITTKEIVNKLFPSYATECFPVWPHYTIKPPETTTEIIHPKSSTPKYQLTKKVVTDIRAKPSTITTPITIALTSEITETSPTAKSITTQTLPTTITTTETTTRTTTTTETAKPITTTTETTTPTTKTTSTTTETTTPITTTTSTTTETTTPTTTTTSTTTETTTTEATTPTTTTTETTTPTTTTTETTTPATTTTETTPTSTTTAETTTPTTTTIETTTPTTTTTETTTPTTMTISTTTEMTTASTTLATQTTPTTFKSIPPITAVIELTRDTTILMPFTTSSTFTRETSATKKITTEAAFKETTLISTTNIKNTSQEFTTQFPISFTFPKKTTSISLTTHRTLFESDFNLNTIGTSSEKPRNCTLIFCQNGGTCISVPKGLKCICKPNWEGLFCDSRADLKVAGFSGKSYVSHILKNSHNIRIDVTMRTVMPMGIIMYSHLASHIFMTLYLENGYLKFKFSCGVQTMILSEVQFQVNNGFDLIATITLDFIPPTRNPFHCTAAVRINNTLAMSGEQLARGPHADSGSAWVYLGGVPIRYIDQGEVPIREGFVGCMRNLMINKEARGIFKDCFESSGIIECKSLACVSNPCRSGSTCVEYNNNTWTCLCPSGFLGKNCEISVCKNNPCQFGGTCSTFPGSGFICLCPAGKQGLFCEKDMEMGYPLFASSVGGLSSFAAYKLPTEIYQDIFLKFKFLPHDMDQISLMVFIGQEGYHGATSDHLAVAFIKGYVVLTWNLGSGPRRIFTPYPVPNIARTFHTVQIGKIGQRAWLVVDNQRNVTGRSPGKLTQLNTKSMLYLGGHESRNFSLLPHDLPLHTGFSGCLFDFELRTGQMLIKMEKSPPAYSRGVGICGSTLCNEFACKNGGGCIHHGATFTCLCSDGWFGPTCSMRYNPCDSSRHNCSEGSTCVPLVQGFSCDCPIGKWGKYCEKNVEFSDVKFTGVRSYLVLTVDLLNQYQSCIDLEIRPLSSQGLILYAGKLESNSFWALTLQDGFVELRVSSGIFTKGKDVVTIKSRRLLTLNKWQRIRAGKYGKRLFLWVEGTLSTGILLPAETLFYSGNIIYLGGIPDLSKLPVGVMGKTTTSFSGCMRKFKSQWKSIPLINSNIKEGRNVEDCDGTVCGGDVCENNGTCHIDASNKPICACIKHYIGRRCEYRLSCKHVSCQNGGRCSNETHSSPICHCPNGWGGPFCESALSVNVPQFKGNSYLVVDRFHSANIKRRDTSNKVDVNFLSINFTTVEPNGMLLWSSSRYNEEFIGIGILNAKLKLVWTWKGKNITTVVFDDHVTDGSWHELIISFSLPNITIWLDQRSMYNSSTDHSGFPLATDGRFFLGGFPENKTVANETFGHFPSGFHGCLQKLAWSFGTVINNFSKYEGENIQPCNPFE